MVAASRVMRAVMPILPGCIGKILEGQGRGWLAFLRYISELDGGYAEVVGWLLRLVQDMKLAKTQNKVKIEPS